MNFIVVLALLTASALADYGHSSYSFSAPVGSGSGTSYSIAGGERITGVRVWERYNSYIHGIQLRFGVVWSSHAGSKSGTLREFELLDHEAIVQISGKYSHYINSLVFVTNKGRTMWTGIPSGLTFNFYPSGRDSELIIVSGRFHGGLTALGAHWATLPSTPTEVHL